MKILSKIDLKLNWKKANKVFAFLKNQEYDVPPDVADYLCSRYNGQFETLSIQNFTKREPIIPIVNSEENGLTELIETPSKTLKQIIEIALKKNIIEQKGTHYFYGSRLLGKGIKKVQLILEEEKELFSEIKNKC